MDNDKWLGVVRQQVILHEQVLTKLRGGLWPAWLDHNMF